MNRTFLALQKEAQFTRDILGSGVTQIRKANYAAKGVYFLSFTSLSTGLERIGKLCLMLDHYIDTGGKFPDLKYLKKQIGHNLILLQEKSGEVISKHGLDISFPGSSIHGAIVRVLCDFAEGDRYSNIDLLVGSSNSSDPASAWFTQVDMPLFERAVGAKKKERISNNSRVIARLMGGVSHVQHTSETGGHISSLEDASFRTGVYESVSPLRQLYVLQIIRYWANLLVDLQYKAMEIGNEDIPFFSEIFADVRTEDRYFKTKRIWEVQ